MRVDISLKKIILTTLLLSSFFGSAFAGGNENETVQVRAEVLDIYRTKTTIPLTAEEKKQIIAFMGKVKEKIPPQLMKDFNSKGIGYCDGLLREMSAEEKAFLKKHIDHLPLLKFLVFINFEDMGLTSLPDNFGTLNDLGFLSLEQNKLESVPPAVTELQKDKRLIFVALTDNSIPAAEFNVAHKKSMEVMYHGNIYSCVKPADLAWHHHFVEPPEASEVPLPEEPGYTALSEALLLMTLPGLEDECRDWLDSSLNRARLAHYLKDNSPEKAAKYIADHPNVLFKENMFGKTPQIQKLELVGAVLAHLAECQLVEINGKETKINENLTEQVPASVFGWTRFFTKEPFFEADNVWLTAEGVHVLFNLIRFYETVYAKGISLEDQELYTQFDEEHDIPFMISEDIRLCRAVGVRNGRDRALSPCEKKWVKKHMRELSQLKFLRYINLAGLELDDVPENFCDFENLQMLYIRHNNIASVTPALEKLYDKYPRLVFNFSLNPIMAGFAEKYTGRDRIAYEKFARDRKIPRRVDSDIKLHKSIGVRDGVRHLVMEREKTWLKDNINDLSQLTFLEHLNLSKMGLTHLPANFAQFTYLQDILLEDNEFTSIPKVLAKIRARNHEFVTYIKGNPLRNNADDRFTKQVVTEAKAILAERKAMAEKEDRERKKLIRKQLVKPIDNLERLVWNPEFVATLGLGKLTVFETPEYKMRDDLQDWYNYWSAEGETKEIERIHAKALRKVKTQMEREERDHTQHLKDNRAKYRHAFFILLTHLADAAQDKMARSGDAFPTFSSEAGQNSASCSSEDIKKKDTRKAWFDDIANKIMVWSLMCTHTPAEFIEFAGNQDEFLKEMTKVRKGWDSKANVKKLYESTTNFFNVLISYLGDHKKLVPFVTQHADTTMKIEHIGHEAYFTRKPNVLHEYKGWYKGQGLAELLMSLKIVLVEEKDS